MTMRPMSGVMTRVMLAPPGHSLHTPPAFVYPFTQAIQDGPPYPSAHCESGLLPKRIFQIWQKENCRTWEIQKCLSSWTYWFSKWRGLTHLNRCYRSRNRNSWGAWRGTNWQWFYSLYSQLLGHWKLVINWCH